MPYINGKHLKLHERNHVEKPFLDQLAGLDWGIIDLDSKKHSGDSFPGVFHRSGDADSVAGAA